MENTTLYLKPVDIEKLLKIGGIIRQTIGKYDYKTLKQINTIKYVFVYKDVIVFVIEKTDKGYKFCGYDKVDYDNGYTVHIQNGEIETDFWKGFKLAVKAFLDACKWTNNVNVIHAQSLLDKLTNMKNA